MCQLTDRFVLCTCEDSAAEPDWILERLDAERSPEYRRGRALRPRFNEDEAQLQQQVLDGLARGCFDFEYAPRDGDVLKLRSGERWFRFRYQRDQWSIDLSTSLTGWRAQMVPMTRGKIDPAG